MKKPIEQPPESANRAALRFLHAYHRAVNLNNSAHQLSDALAMEPQPRARLCAEILLRALAEAHITHALCEAPFPTSLASDPRFAVYSFLVTQIREVCGNDTANDIVRRVHVLSTASECPDNATLDNPSTGAV